MTYIKIVWETLKDEKELIKSIILAVGNYSLQWYDIKATRQSLMRLEKRVNEFVEKYIKTNYRVKIPLIEKGNNDIGWFEARLNGQVDFELYEV